jgi:signal transduction histidine kinase
MDYVRFQAIQRYVDFGPECLKRLRKFAGVAGTDLQLVVDDFYDAIRRDPDAEAVLTGGAAQVQRLKTTLHEWLTALLEGPRDEAYVASRSRIGRIHVRINLSQEYMLTAVNRVRVGLRHIATARLASDEVPGTIDAIDRALDVDLALMLDTYREDSLTRVDASARLAAVGQVAASIGHELRNPLGVAGSSLYLIRQRLDKLGQADVVLDRHVGRVEAQLRVCSETITSMLEMARDAPLLRSQFPLVAAIEECLHTLRTDDVVVHIDVEGAMQVFADREQLISVIGNLLRNALDAVEFATTKRVTVTAADVKGGVEFIIEDSGAGVEETNRPRIFDALFTTRPRGTGLGLALCKNIVDRHGGEIGLLPTGNAGARFRVWLPSPPLARFTT